MRWPSRPTLATVSEPGPIGYQLKLHNGFCVCEGGSAVYKQVLDPVSHSLGLTSIFAILPLLVLFLLLGVVRMKAHWASLITLGVAVAVAVVVYNMPFGQA